MNEWAVCLLVSRPVQPPAWPHGPTMLPSRPLTCSSPQTNTHLVRQGEEGDAGGEGGRGGGLHLPDQQDDLEKAQRGQHDGVVDCL